MKISVKLVLIGLMFTAVASAQEYNIDTAHSSMGFTVKHLLISDVDGVFDDYKVTFNMVRQNIRKFDVDVQVKSVDTRNEKRDNDLQSENFFQASKYPNITFRSKGYKRISASEGMIFGDLTIKDVTKRVILNVKISDTIQFQGKEVVGVSIDGKLNRKEFNVGSNYPSAVVGDEIALKINLQVKK